jgi:hypothetical protein
MDAQEEHDYRMSKVKKFLEPGSRQRLEALLQKKRASSSTRSQPEQSNPLALLLKAHPGLTAKEVAEDLDNLGF